MDTVATVLIEGGFHQPDPQVYTTTQSAISSPATEITSLRHRPALCSIHPCSPSAPIAAMDQAAGEKLNHYALKVHRFLKG